MYISLYFLTEWVNVGFTFGFTFLVPAHLGSPGKGPLNVCVWVNVSSGTGLPG